MLLPLILTACSNCETRSCFCHQGGRKEGTGNIREHIFTVESMKDDCNDEERQDNSQAGKDMRGESIDR